MPKEIREFYPGSLHLFVGGMKGGKTDRLIQNLNKIKYSDKSYQVFTPESAYRKEIYEKYRLTPENIVSRNGKFFPC